MLLTLLLLACAPKVALPTTPGLPTLELPPPGVPLVLEVEGRVQGHGAAGPLPAAPVQVPAGLTMDRLRPVLARQAAGGASDTWLIDGDQGAWFQLLVGEPPGAPVPALEVGVWSDHLAWHRGPGVWTALPDVEAASDLAGLLRVLRADRKATPAGLTVGIAAAPDVAWGRTAEVLGVLKAAGYTTRVVRAGAPAAEAPEGLVPVPEGWSWEIDPQDVVSAPSALVSVPLAGPLVLLAADGRAWVDRRQVPGGAGGLAAALQAGARPSELRLAIDGEARAAAVREVLDAARASGAERVGFVSARAPGQGLPVELRGSVWGRAGAEVAGSEAARARQSRTPLSVELAADALYVGRGSPLLRVAHVGGAPDLPRLSQILASERPTDAVDRALLVRLDDDVPFARALSLLDVLEYAGWTDPWITGGPPSVRVAPAPLATAATVRVPKAVVVGPDGTFQLDQTRVSLEHVDGFLEQCAGGTCAVAVVLETGEAWFLGRFPERPADQPGAGWLFQRPVSAWAGKLPRTAPSVTGALRVLVGNPSSSPAIASSGAAPGAGATSGRGGSGSSTSTTTTVAVGTSSGDALTDAVVACYTAAMGRNPSVRGRIVVTATVASDGKLLGTTLSSSSLGDTTADTCILAAVKQHAKVTGAKSTGITTVQFPFTLSPG